MPIFEFRCVQCGHVFEEIFKSSNEDIKLECPECHCDSVDRVLSVASHVMGSVSGGQKATLTEKTCGSGNSCYTMDIPGPTK